MAHRVRRFRRVLLNRHRRIVDVLHRNGNGVIAVKRHTPGEHLVERHADAVNIARDPCFLARRLFGAEVVHRPHDGIALSKRILVCHARDAEIRHLHMPVGLHEDILRLNVTVDDAVGMCVLQRRENTDGNLHC